MRVANPTVTIEQELLLLNLLRKEGALSRRQLSEFSGFSVSLVRQLTQHLVATEMIVETGTRPADSLGRPSQFWALAPNACLAVGLDVGGRSTRVIVLDTLGNPLYRHTVLTPSDEDAEALLSFLRDLVQGALISIGERKQYVRGLGVAFSGFIDNRSGASIAAPNIAAGRNLPLQTYLERELRLPVMIDDSTRAMTLSEMRYGLGIGIADFLCINVGTGIGMGVVVNGRLYRGSMGFAGEIGHIPMQPYGDRCHCGSQGCLETLASGRAIAARARQMLEQRVSSVLHEMTEGSPWRVSAEMVTQAAQLGDQLALDLLQNAGMWLGVGIAMALNLFSPTRVILTGGVMRENHLLLSMAQESADRYTLPHFPRPLPIMLTQLTSDVGALGAASLILDDEFERGFTERLASE